MLRSKNAAGRPRLKEGMMDIPLLVAVIVPSKWKFLGFSRDCARIFPFAKINETTKIEINRSLGNRGIVLLKHLVEGKLFFIVSWVINRYKSRLGQSIVPPENTPKLTQFKQIAEYRIQFWTRVKIKKCKLGAHSSKMPTKPTAPYWLRWEETSFQPSSRSTHTSKNCNGPDWSCPLPSTISWPSPCTTAVVP